ncbi:Ankyrin repeat-containing domain protein [Lactarius tabidus]
MSLLPASSSKTPTTATPSSNFNVIFDKALKAYKVKTKQDLATHPLAKQLNLCDSPAAILTILQDQVRHFEKSRSGDERLRRWLGPTINVLYAFTETLGVGVGIVFSPAQAVFAGAGVLLLAAKDVEASQDVLIDIFERIENFFRRLEVYTHVQPTPAMTDMMVKIMVEVLDILATATKEMKQSRFKMFLKRVAGIKKLDDGLQKLDKMTNEEARMANAEVLRLAHTIDKNVQGVNKGVQGVSVQVRDVDENVRVIREMVQMIISDRGEATKCTKLVLRIAYDARDANRMQLRDDFRQWQSPLDPSTNHNIACNLQHAGTAEWFFDGNIFEEWKVAGSLLWIHGRPGSGKSVLCSAIIKKRSRRNLLPSLLHQLAARSDPFCDVLSGFYKAHDDGTCPPTDGALMDCLKEMLMLPDQAPVYLILDALDECPNTSGAPSFREQVLDLVRVLVNMHLRSLHICVTSRPEVDIMANLQGIASHSVSLHDESGQQKDIARYVESVVYSREMRRWRDADKVMVIKTLSERADGMFRWVFCQLETLRNCLPQNVPRALSELPTTLDDTYERVLKEITPANQHHAYRLLQCLTVASRPLRVDELAEILALDFDKTKEGIPDLKEDWRWIEQQKAVLSTCSSLIAVVDSGRHRVVQFSHFSAKEFLTSDRLAASSADVSHFHIPLESAHTVMVRACLGVLLRSDVGGTRAKNNSPLAKYAAKHWVDHAQFGNVSRSVDHGMRRLFDLTEPHFTSWLRLCDIDSRWDNYVGYNGNIPRGSPLYYASLCGFYDLATHLIDKHSQHVNARCGQNRSPLAAALRNEHFRVAELLLQHGANMGIKGDLNRTLLHAASVNGALGIGDWLLAHGVDANSQEDNHDTSLHLAVKNGRLEFVQMLLKHEAVVNAVNKDNHTSLNLAIDGGHFEIMQLLLRHDADVATQDLKHSTPLHLATARGSHEITRQLIFHGADVNVLDGNGKTPLHLASPSWCPASVRLLVELGADVNVPDGNHQTSLHLASCWGDTKTLHLLIKHGADVNARDASQSTPLHLVSSLGKTRTMQILMENGADVNARDASQSTPLHLASTSWSPDVMRLLIKHGADVNVLDANHRTPMHLAASQGKIQNMQLLIDNGADVNVQDADHLTPWQLTSFFMNSRTF